MSVALFCANSLSLVGINTKKLKARTHFRLKIITIFLYILKFSKLFQSIIDAFVKSHAPASLRVRLR